MATIQDQRVALGYGVSSGNNDAQNEALDISSSLDILKPVDVPLLTLIGKDSLKTPCVQVKHEWLEDEIRGMTTVTSGLNNTTDPVTVTLTTAAHSTYFRATGGNGSPANYVAANHTTPGDIVRVWDGNGEEIAIVTARTSTTIDLDRSQLGSTPVSHTTSCNVTIIGTFQPQGLTDVGVARTTTKSNVYNYTQIFEDSLKLSKTNQATRKFTAQNDREYQLARIMEVMGVQMERSLIFGKRQAPSAGAGAFGGIQSFLSTNVYDKNGAALTQTMLEDALEDVWDAGAKATHIIVNATQKRRINTFMDAYRQVDYGSERLGTAVSSYETDFGTVSVVLDRHMPTNEVLIIDAERIGFGPLAGRALSMKPVAVHSKEADVWEISGEYTVEVHSEKAHARIHDLATTGLY